MNFKPYPKFVLRRPAFNYDCSALTDEKLCGFLDNDVFLEAIYYASPELYCELNKIAGTGNKKDISKRTLDTIYKYLSRLSNRSTPFGTFALCSVGDYGESIVIPDGNNIIKSYKYDGQLLYNVAGHILNEEFHELSNLKLKCNETLHKVGKFYFLWARLNSGEMELIKVPATELLQFCVDLTVESISTHTLTNRILDEFDIEETDVCNYIKNLHKKGILIDNMSPETVGADNLLRFETVCNGSNIDLTKALRKNIDSLALKSSFQEKLYSIKELKTALENNGIKYKEKQLIQVDSYSSGQSVLPMSVKKSIQEIFIIYRSFSIQMQNPLASFIKRYQARYDQQSVSVLEALNPVCGIGYHNNIGTSSNLIKSILNKAGKQSGKAYAVSINLSVIEQLVLEKIIDTGDVFTRRIQLTYNDLKPYLTEDFIDFPLSYTAMFKIVGWNSHGPVISNVNFSGPSGTSLLTRFAHGNKEIEFIVKDIADIEQRNHPESILAEISHLTSPHSENVQSRPLLRSAMIPYASQNSSASQTIINIHDLYIRISNGKVHLYSKKLNKEVIPCFSSAFNYIYRSSELYKFLGDVLYQNGSRAFKPSFQGLLKLLKHIPRIEYKNVIICPECWILSEKDLFIKNKFSIDKFRKFHDAKNMPRFLLYAQGDNTFVVDIETERSIEILGKLITSKSTIVLEEFLPQTADFNHYDSILEIVQPFVPDI